MKLFRWLIRYVLLQFLIVLIWALFYNDLNTFNIFLNKYYIFLVLAVGLTFIPLLKKNYLNKDDKINKKDIFLSIILGTTLSIIYNFIIYNLNEVYSFTNLYSGSTNILIAIISTGIIGPIIEEYMIRGIMYNELKQKYSIMKSIIITTIIFSLLHFNLVQMIYALVLGFILIYMYEKTNNIKAPLILHMTSNIVTTIYCLILNNFLISFIIYIISLIILILIFKKYINLNKM
ncbi:MAG: type II CAAX endopeptidase family protein [Candidatus Faecisoma sp.]|nr:CPBP family intramembrane metalloprotease [Acholeplasma sp.]MDY2892328.1 type II CAAX endopeptidase family protein [Candidatus Faecisoma sp.]